MSSSVHATSERPPGLTARLGAEALGTMFLVLVAAGTKIFSTQQGGPAAALATGLAVAAAMIAFGYVSGGHFNPAITLANLIAGRIRAVAALGYVVAQVLGAVVGAALVYFVVLASPVLADARAAMGTAAAGFGEHSSAQTQMAGVLLLEVIGTALLAGAFLGATAGRRAIPVVAPFAVGLATAVLLQFGEVLGNLPFNPARATGQAFFSPSWALDGLWLFWVAPLLGAALAGFVFRGFSDAGVRAVQEPEPESEPGQEREEAGHAAEAVGAVAPADEVVPADRKVASADEARDFFDGKKG